MNEIIKKNGINYGVITGVFSVLFTVIIYLVDLSLMTKWWVGVTMLIGYLVIGILLLSKTKKELNGVFPFKDAFVTYFISALVGIGISLVFNILLYNYIDPEAAVQLKELTITSTVEMMQKFGAPADAITEAVAKLQSYNQFSTFELAKGSIWSVVGSIIFGLILALIFRSKPQVE